MNTNVEAPLAKIESATPPVGGVGVVGVRESE